ALSKELLKVLKKQKVKFNLSHKVKSVTSDGKEVVIRADDKQGSEVVFTGDYCLVSVGRQPCTEGLNVEAAGVRLDKHGTEAVNDQLQTSIPAINVIGAGVRGAVLAHKAEEEVSRVAEL